MAEEPDKSVLSGTKVTNMDDKEFRTFCDAQYKALKEDGKEPGAALNSTKDIIESMLSGQLSEKQTTLFVNSFLTKTVTAATSRSYLMHEDVQSCKELLRVVLRLVKEFIDQDMQPIVSSLHAVMNNDCKFYKQHGRDRPIDESKELEDSEELQVFRKEVNLFDWIDVYSDGIWKEAQVSSVSIDESQWRVHFKHSRESHDEWVEKTSLRIAPRGSKSRAHIDQWRLDLEKDSRCDVLDTVNKWYFGTVLEVKDDILLFNYEGWSQRFDEWIPRTSERLAPLKTFAVGGKESGGVQMVYQDRRIDDSEDPDDAKTMFRGKTWSTYFLYENVTYFAELGGYDAIIQRVSNTDKSVPVTIVRGLSECVAKGTVLFSKSYAATLIPAFKEAVFNSILSLSDAEIRNLSKDHLEEITKSMSTLLNRVLDSEAVWKETERFNLAAALKRLKCPVVERQINGMTYLSEAVSRIRHSHYRTSMTSAEMIVWLQENEVLEMCFGKGSHTELQRRAANVLKFLASEKQLTTHHMDMIWNATTHAMRMQEVTNLEILFKLLDDIAYCLQAEHIAYLFARMRELPFEELVKSTVDLIKELSRLTHRDEMNVAEEATGLLWSIAQDGSRASNDISQYAMTKLNDVLTEYAYKEQRVPYLKKCIESIRNHTSVAQSLEMMRKILDCFPVQSPIDDHTRWSMIEDLENEHKVVEAIFDDLQWYRDAVAKEVGADVDVSQYVLQGQRVSYISAIKRRMFALRYLLSHSSLKLSEEQAETIWSRLYEDSQTPQEREYCLNWLRNSCDLKGEAFPVFDDHVIEFLFERKVVEGIDFANLTLAGYECLERLFLVMNKAKKNLHVTSSQESMTLLVTNLPLAGFDVFWRVAFECNHATVVDKCITFMNSLMEKLTAELQTQLPALRADYVKKCMAHYNEFLNNGNAEKIQRCLILLNQCLDASEAKGLGSLRSHDSQLRGDRLPLRIYNNVSRDNKQFSVLVYTNDILWNLREAIAKELQVNPESLRLFSGPKELTNDMNSRKLNSLQLRPNNVVNVTRRKESVEKLPLLNHMGDLTDATRSVLVAIFHRFASKPDAMTHEDMEKYIVACAGEESASINRIPDIFESYGEVTEDGKPLLMHVDGFLEFYKTACRTRPQSVWKDITVHGYGPNLTLELTPEQRAKLRAEEEKYLPRVLLASNNEYFNVLFQSLTLENAYEVTTQVWSLLQRLPTNPTLKHDLVTLDKVDDAHSEWDSLLDSTSSYKLLYCLQVIQSLSSSDSDENTEEESEQHQWRRKFLVRGGFKHLYSILLQRSQTNTESLASEDGVEAEVISMLLRVLRVFLVSAIAVQAPDLQIVERLGLDKQNSKDDSQSDIPDPPAIEPGSTDDMPQLETVYGPQLPGSDYLVSFADDVKESPAPEAEAENKEAAPEEPELSPVGALQRQMSIPFAKQLMTFVDFPTLQLSLVRIIESSAQLNLSRSTDIARFNEIVSIASSLWVAIVVFRPDELIPALLKRIDKDCVFGVLQSPLSTRIQSAFSEAIYQICSLLDERQEVSQHFLSVLEQSVPSAEAKASEVSATEEQFSLLARLLQDAMQSDSSHDSMKSLVERTTQALQAHVSTETYEDSCIDHVLVGLLRILKSLLSYPPFKHMGLDVHTLFHTMLFSESALQAQADEKVPEVNTSQDGADVKCKTPQSRQAAFELLVSLCTGHADNLNALCNLLTLLHARITKVSGWDYNPEKHMISPCGYVGLRNLGATCYMNSLLQQFFMIPNIRYGIMMIDDTEENKTESLLYQLQTMFSFLSFSKKQAYDTTPFCFSYKDDTGRPINVRVQQDVQEFFNVLTDRIERKLKGTPFTSIFKGVLGGQVCNQLICHGGCDSVRESLEEYYTVSLEVKTKSSLEESLEHYVAGEVLQDYNCQTCKRRVEINKRACLGVMSNTIVFHLKRFDLNWETFEHEKLNNRFEFPHTVNLEPYTKEGLARRDALKRAAAQGGDDAKGQEGKGIDDAKGANAADESSSSDGKEADTVVVPPIYSEHPKEYYEYRLVGVIVHTGTAQGGHYYSFISDRKPESQWFEFNDNYIRPFDTSKLEEECFGGMMETVESSSWGPDYVRSTERIKNAYMLIYERVSSVPEPVPAEVSETAAPSSEVGAIENLRQLVDKKEDISPAQVQSMIERVVSNDSFASLVPPRIMSAIKADNAQFMTDRQVFNPTYFSFLSSIVALKARADTSDPASDGIIKLGTGFLLDTLVRMSENQVLPEFIVNLKTYYLRSPGSCTWLAKDLSTKPTLITDVLLGNRDNITRKSILDFLVEIVKALYPVEKDVLNSDPECGLASFFTCYLSIIPEAPKHWTRFSDFFQLLFEFANLGQEAKQFLLGADVVVTLGNLVLGDYSPHRDRTKRAPQMGNRLVSPEYKYLLKIMSTLICACATEHKQAGDDGLLELPPKVVEIVKTKELYTTMLKENHSPSAIAAIVRHWAYGNEIYSASICDIVIDGVDRANHDNVKPFFDVMQELVAVEDDLQSYRMERLTRSDGIIDVLHRYCRNHGKFTYVSVKCLLGIIDTNPTFAEHMMAVRQSWVWIDSWLKGYVSQRPSSGGSSAPPLKRQESREETFNKYLQHVERLGGVVDVDADGDDNITISSNNADLSGGEEGTVGGNPHKRPRGNSDPSSVVRENPNKRGLSLDDTDLGSSSTALVPIGSVQDVSELAKWNCKACTLENNALVTVCTVCRTPKDQIDLTVDPTPPEV